MDFKKEFVQQISDRSNENKVAFKLLYENKMYGVCIGLLRQELDTLIRLAFLQDSIIDDRNKII